MPFKRLFGSSVPRPTPMNLRLLAEGQPCQIRLPGICNRRTDTTVLAHFRLGDVSGFGLKSPDFIGAWACYACHNYVDTHHDDETQLAFAHGVFRTQRTILDAYARLRAA